MSMYVGKKWRHLPSGRQGKCIRVEQWGGKLWLDLDLSAAEFMIVPAAECCPALYVVGGIHV